MHDVAQEVAYGREQRVFQAAQQLFEQQPDWVTFFRTVLGVGGAMREEFRTPEEISQFEQSKEYFDIQVMLTKLRERAGSGEPATKEPTRVITVRLPQSLHESLRTEAHERRTSMNQLCISKLLQMIENELIPAE